VLESRAPRDVCREAWRRCDTARLSQSEIALTIAIGMTCAVGLIGGASPTAGVSAPRRLIIAVLFAAAQIAALVSSMLLPHIR
jgi:hypothetical protein